MQKPTTSPPTLRSEAPVDSSGVLLTVDLDALAENYRRLNRLSDRANCAAVVKANAYGLGIVRVAPALHRAGCRTFFVATFAEATGLRDIFDANSQDAEVFVLNGISVHDSALAQERRLVPVLNSLEHVATWRTSAAGQPEVAIHVDTAMSRLGLSIAAATHLLGQSGLYEDLHVTALLSHLACSEKPDHPLNRQQLERFSALRKGLPPLRAGIANSSGIFLGPEFRFDLVRAGVALYGANPTPDHPNPMSEVINLKGKIIQTQQIDRGMTVGYGAAFTATRPMRLATVPVGYADGYARALGNRGFGEIGGVRVPVVGRVSMDLTVFDVTDVAPGIAVPGSYIQLIGGAVSLDEVAKAAETISYEILVRLGPRLERNYVGTAE